MPNRYDPIHLDTLSKWIVKTPPAMGEFLIPEDYDEIAKSLCQESARLI
jgi:hypothetical protein